MTAKSFAWSYSRVKNYEECPLRYHEVDVLKRFKEDGTALNQGLEDHKMLARAINTRTPLFKEPYVPHAPVVVPHPWQHWIDEILASPGEIMAEQQYALKRDFTPAEWFSPQTWFRCVIDVLRLDDNVADITDWKTGKIIDDPVQLVLNALTVFAHYPKVERIRSRFVWLAHGEVTELFFSKPEQVKKWLDILPRADRLEAATKTNTFNPKPGRLCKRYCPVTSCQFHGKGG